MGGRVEAKPLLGGEGRSDSEEDSEGLESLGLPDPRVPVHRRSLCQRLTARLRLVEEGATPPNWKYIFLMFISLFSSAFSLTYTFPFLPDMMLSFGYPEEEKGYYVGLVASCVFAGRAVGSFFWGWLSDIKGRRLVLLVTIFGNGVFILLFGFATNLPMAMILRFMTGLVNGTVGTAKTVLYEVSDNSNQALGMTTISLAGGFGLILGPFLGGFLASPARRFPSTFSAEGFFGRLPFFLPSFVGFWVCMLVLLVVFLQFEETLKRSAKKITKQRPESAAASSSTCETEPRDSTKTPTINTNARFVAQTQRVDLFKTESDSATAAPRTAGSVQPSGGRQAGSEDSLDGGGAGRLEHWAGSTTSTSKAELEAGTAGKADFVDAPLESNDDIHSAGIFTEKDNNVENERIHLDSADSRGQDEQNISQNTEGLHSGSFAKNITTEDADNAQGDSSDDSTDDSKETSTLLRGSPDHSEKGGATRRRNRGKVSSSMTNKTSDLQRSSWFLRVKQSRPIKLIGDSDVRKSVGLYTFFSFAVIGFEDVFTVWASTKTGLGGLGFSSGEIGVALGTLAIPMLVLQVKLFPVLTRRYGIIKAFLICDVFLMFTIQVTPTLHLLAHRKTLLWVLLMTVIIPNKMASNSCYAASSLLINNSVTTDNAGTVNGIAMTTTAFARTFAPAVGGSIFAWTVSYAADNIGAPFDVSLAFFVMGLAVFATLLAAIFMPHRLNSQRKNPQSELAFNPDPEDEGT